MDPYGGALVFNGLSPTGILQVVSTTARELEVAAIDLADEARLVEDARAGDSFARERLVSRHLSDVYGVAYRILGDRDLAQDAVQDAFVNALNALSRFRGDSSFRTWLLRIAVNAARSTGRRRTRRREVALGIAEELATGHPDPASAAVLRSEVARVRDALRRLPEKQRLSVSLRAEQGLAYAEIAKIIGSSEGAVRVNYHLGVRRLRELLG